MAIITVNNSELDNLRLSNILTPIDVTLKDFDFSKVVVNKPWGYEYLLYSNKDIAIWIMYIKRNFGNSMHCHLEKKTALVLLSGEAVFSTLEDGHRIKEGDTIKIDKKVFHSTQAISDEGIFVMEIETPVNKVDLLRLSDSYGRETKGYESQNEISMDTEKYNAIFFDKKELNVTKKVGDMNLCFKNFEDDEDLIKYINENQKFKSAIVEGTILDNVSGAVMLHGEILSNNDLQDRKIKISKKPLTLLSISKDD